jgi:hypothetical protein
MQAYPLAAQAASTRLAGCARIALYL